MELLKSTFYPSGIGSMTQHCRLSVLLVLPESIWFKAIQMEMPSAVFTDQSSRQQGDTSNKEQFQHHTPGEQVIQRGDMRQHWTRLDADEVVRHQAWKSNKHVWKKCYKYQEKCSLFNCIYQWRQPWRKEWQEYSVLGRSCLRTSLDSWERISGTAEKRTSYFCFPRPGRK